jgi:hypothetical protein
MTLLRQRMLDDLRIRNYAPSTVTCYIRAVAQFAKHYISCLHPRVCGDQADALIAGAHGSILTPGRASLRICSNNSTFDLQSNEFLRLGPAPESEYPFVLEGGPN